MKALDLGNKRVFSTVLKLTLPAMLAQFVSVLYSIVDRMYVGNIEGTGDVALTALGVCAPVATLLTSFGSLVGLGGALLSTTVFLIFFPKILRKRAEVLPETKATENA